MSSWLGLSSEGFSFATTSTSVPSVPNHDNSLGVFRTDLPGSLVIGSFGFKSVLEGSLLWTYLAESWLIDCVGFILYVLEQSLAWSYLLISRCCASRGLADVPGALEQPLQARCHAEEKVHCRSQFTSNFSRALPVGISGVSHLDSAGSLAAEPVTACMSLSSNHTGHVLAHSNLVFHGTMLRSWSSFAALLPIGRLPHFDSAGSFAVFCAQNILRSASVYYLCSKMHKRAFLYISTFVQLPVR
eukprot:6492802-Amphidinium_carterae.3